MTTNQLLAEIRELTVEMHEDYASDQPVNAMTENGHKYLKLCADILRQVRADGAPRHPVVLFVREYVSPEEIADWL